MTFCVNGASFDAEQYYRDDGLARDVLWQCRENPVLITGLRRIGKSWFLRRFEQIARTGATRHFADDGTPSLRQLDSDIPRVAAVLDGGSETLESELDDVLRRSGDGAVLAVDELEKLVLDRGRAPLLLRILGHRPLILAASPLIFELAHEHVPALASLFEEGGCISKVLRPLSSGERRALALQTCDPGEGVPASSVSMATWWDWGGHPLVLQQVGTLIRERAAMDAQALLNAAHARLNLGAPRYGLSLSGESGLTRAQREVLTRVAKGEEPGDEHMAAVLDDHGAIVRRKSGWTVENCVLRRHLQGGGEAAPRTPAAVPARPAKAKAPVRVFSWIHLSDLHFGAGSVKHRFDHLRVMRAIREDVRDHFPRPVDRILVTGDIAFSAQESEYREARPWLTAIATGAGAGESALRFVPGNHDVDRRAAKKAVARCIHRAVRERDVDLDELLADDEGRVALLGKLAAYRGFVAAVPGHPAPLGSNGLDWFEAIPAKAGGHGALRVVGLSSVWISDEDDGHKDGTFVPNMVLGRAPLDPTFGEAGAHEVILALSHHPQEWFHKDALALLEPELDRFSHVQLCGHVHDAKAGVTKRFGRKGKAVRYVAGAAHGDASESAKHGYAWGAIRYDPGAGTWQAGWAPRVYLNGAMCADSTGRELDAGGFAWEAVDFRWPVPESI
jgi:hypothetical protein